MNELDHDSSLANADHIGPDASLLIVDDDGPFLRRLARAMETRGFTVETAESVAEGVAKSKSHPP
jgi:two-component system response regulator RegA